MVGVDYTHTLRCYEKVPRQQRCHAEQIEDHICETITIAWGVFVAQQLFGQIHADAAVLLFVVVVVVVCVGFWGWRCCGYDHR